MEQECNKCTSSHSNNLCSGTILDVVRSCCYCGVRQRRRRRGPLQLLQPTISSISAHYPTSKQVPLALCCMLHISCILLRRRRRKWYHTTNQQSYRCMPVCLCRCSYVLCTLTLTYVYIYIYTQLQYIHIYIHTHTLCTYINACIHPYLHAYLLASFLQSLFPTVHPS